MQDSAASIIQDLIIRREDWLMERILRYAVQYEYAQYTSTLKESWRMSISGLSESILEALKRRTFQMELGPEIDYIDDPVAAFGILEGQRHRERGIDIGMFLGLLRYYRQSYLDVLAESACEPDVIAWGRHGIERCFDRIEIGLCSEWIRGSDADRIRELQTANRRITNEKNKYLTLFESLANPVILLDRQNRIEQLNRAAARLLDASGNRYYSLPDSALPVGQPAEQALPWLADELRRFRREAAPSCTGEKACVRDSETRWYRFDFSHMLDISDKFTGTLIILTDETTQKETELALQHAKTAAEDANRAKSAFLANMSHELRTPLNGILGYAQILKRDSHLLPHQLQAVDTIDKSGEHLLAMITDILDIAKIEAGKVQLHPEDFTLDVSLRAIVEMMRIKAEQKQIHIIYEPPDDLRCVVHADEKRLRQVLINLLGNAIKFTLAGHVSFTVEKHDAPSQESAAASPSLATLSFSITDTGIGIPVEKQAAIFHSFEQVGDTRIHEEGTGLGLAISARIVRIMGSELHVESMPGRGSRFWFQVTLPVKAITPERARPRHRITGLDGPPRRILIIDDDESSRRMLRQMLEPLGFTIADTADGLAGLEYVRRSPFPDLLLLDIKMPELNGYETARRLRHAERESAEPARHVPIIAISAEVSEHVRQHSLAAGCDAFLAKPIHLEHLLDTIAALLRITWRYAPADSDFTPSESVLPPPDMLLALHNAARIGDIMDLRRQIRVLRRDPLLTPFLNQIHELVEGYRIDQVQNLLDRCLADSAPCEMPPEALT